MPSVYDACFEALAIAIDMDAIIPPTMQLPEAVTCLQLEAVLYCIMTDKADKLQLVNTYFKSRGVKVFDQGLVVDKKSLKQLNSQVQKLAIAYTLHKIANAGVSTSCMLKVGRIIDTVVRVIRMQSGLESIVSSNMLTLIASLFAYVEMFMSNTFMDENGYVQAPTDALLNNLGDVAKQIMTIYNQSYTCQSFAKDDATIYKRKALLDSNLVISDDNKKYVERMLMFTTCPYSIDDMVHAYETELHRMFKAKMYTYEDYKAVQAVHASIYSKLDKLEVSQHCNGKALLCVQRAYGNMKGDSRARVAQLIGALSFGLKKKKSLSLISNFMQQIVGAQVMKAIAGVVTSVPSSDELTKFRLYEHIVQSMDDVCLKDVNDVESQYQLVEVLQVPGVVKCVTFASGNELIICVRGTTELKDVLADINIMPYFATFKHADGTEVMGACHRGMMYQAVALFLHIFGSLVNEQGPESLVYTKVFHDMDMNGMTLPEDITWGANFKELFLRKITKVHVVGHSLGAGTAGLLTLLIHQAITLGSTFAHMKVRGMGIGCPAVLSKSLNVVIKDIFLSINFENDPVDKVGFVHVMKTLLHMSRADNLQVPTEFHAELGDLLQSTSRTQDVKVKNRTSEERWSAYLHSDTQCKTFDRYLIELTANYFATLYSSYDGAQVLMSQATKQVSVTPELGTFTKLVRALVSDTAMSILVEGAGTLLTKLSSNDKKAVKSRFQAVVERFPTMHTIFTMIKLLSYCKQQLKESEALKELFEVKYPQPEFTRYAVSAFENILSIDFEQQVASLYTTMTTNEIARVVNSLFTANKLKFKYKLDLSKYVTKLDTEQKENIYRYMLRLLCSVLQQKTLDYLVVNKNSLDDYMMVYPVGRLYSILSDTHAEHMDVEQPVSTMHSLLMNYGVAERDYKVVEVEHSIFYRENMLSILLLFENAYIGDHSGMFYTDKLTSLLSGHLAKSGSDVNKERDDWIYSRI